MFSMCEHHLVPFHGVAHVGYIPGRTARSPACPSSPALVDLYARRPQVQERLTTQVADASMRGLDARGVIVVIEAEHLCMAMRGVRKPGARTMTSAVRGQFASDPRHPRRGPRTDPGRLSDAPPSRPRPVAAPRTRRARALPRPDRAW